MGHEWAYAPIHISFLLICLFRLVRLNQGQVLFGLIQKKMPIFENLFSNFQYFSSLSAREYSRVSII